METKKQQLSFNPELIFSTIKEWKNAAERYDQAAQKHYKRIRSYLTIWQFRLSDDTKCAIREKLAQHLDEITDHDFVQDLDSFLEGFCFQLDKSVIPSQPKEVKIQVAPPKTPEPVQMYPATSDTTSDTIDYNDLDYYTLQFFQ